MKLDKNTYGTVVLIYVLSAVGIVLLLCFVPQWWIKWPLTLFLLWLSAWQTYFHMVPDRKPAGSEHLVSSVSDGRNADAFRLHGFLGPACELLACDR